MHPTTATDLVTRLRADCAGLGRELVESGHRLTPDEAFGLAGELQGLVNAAEGAQGLAAACGARVEHTLHEPTWRERVHPVGFVDEMAPAEMSAATGLTEGLAGRKVALGAALASRFPHLRDLVLAGDLPAASAHKVVDACAGLDPEACARVDAALAPRLAGMDPARVARAARETAARVAADQVAAQQERTRRGRTVQVRPGDDGLTEWWALLPTETSAAMVAAVEDLADRHRADDPDLTMAQARADALCDLVLENVTVSAQVTLGIPVISDPAAPRPSAPDPSTPDPSTSGPTGSGPAAADEPGGPTTRRVRVEHDDDETVVDAVTGVETRYADLTAASREELSWVTVPADDHLAPDLRFTSQTVLSNGAAVSGCDLPGVGFVPAGVVAGMLRALPLDVTRAMFEADTGTLVSTTSRAYTPPTAVRTFVTTRDGTCRMWGCMRSAVHLDLDHTEPWPDGATAPVNLAGLCRRHHRLKQQGRWRYVLRPDGTVIWTGPAGQRRVTEPQHRLLPPPWPPPVTAPPRTPWTHPALPPPF